MTNNLPKQGFYAVIFSSEKYENPLGYAEMDELTFRLAKEQEGFLGFETVGNNTHSIFISYWKSKDCIDKWRNHATHKLAKSQAEKWYKRYLSQICYVEHSSLFLAHEI